MGQITKKNGSVTTYALRRALGVKAKRASGYNACVGSALKGKSYSKPAAGTGGRHDERIQGAFKSAVSGCKGGRRTSRAKKAE